MIRSTGKIHLLFAGLLAAPLGCSSGQVNIGNTQNLGGKLSDYAAQWDGYAEAYTFGPSNSDRIRLVLDGQGQGTVQIGSDALLPAPTDPNVGYPAGVTIDSNWRPSSGLSGGVLYPVYAAQVQASRIQLGLKPNDYYKAWCALQTSYHILVGYMSQPPDGGGVPLDGGWYPTYAYSCNPEPGAGENLDTHQCTLEIDNPDGSHTYPPIDCGKMYLCAYQVCDCNATGCGAFPALDASSIAAQYPVELDAALDATGTNMTGTLNIAGTRVTIHLQRQ
jgi:hypothetical protein